MGLDGWHFVPLAVRAGRGLSGGAWEQAWGFLGGVHARGGACRFRPKLRPRLSAVFCSGDAQVPGPANCSSSSTPCFR
jgi:hypothetical protein